MDLQITSKTLWFQVGNESDQHIIDNIVQAGRNPLTCCENLIKVENNVLLFNRHKKMSLRHGMITLQHTFKLIDAPIRIKPDSINNDCMVKILGEVTRSELHTLVADLRAKSQKPIKVKRAISSVTVQCSTDKDIALNQKQNKNETHLSKDLDHGKEIHHTVHQTNKRISIKSFKDTSYPNCTTESFPTEMSNNNYCLDKMMAEDQREKRKHYFIYSNNPGYGKTPFSSVLQENINACNVPDLNNFCGVRKNAQFLIFDCYSHESKLSYRDLCLLTGGDASAFRGRKKTR